CACGIANPTRMRFPRQARTRHARNGRNCCRARHAALAYLANRGPVVDGTRMKRRFFIPEVVQTSSMDCGPASLKALFGGFGIYLSYGRLREACQTDVDGTSIETLENVAQALGLDVSQRMVPADFLLSEESACLPAIVVVRMPDGATHFVVV